MMAIYLIEKSNRGGRWTGRQWWVEADTAEEALQIGRERYPSKNTVDQFHARLLTEDEINEFYQQQAEHDFSRRRPVNRQADRLAAYYDKCRANKIRALNKNVKALFGVTPVIEAVAERINQDAAEKIEECSQ